jgi:type I restriction enzyme S subunit
MTALVTGNLPLISGAPNGIAKLRELILDLAVRGALAVQGEQLQSDETEPKTTNGVTSTRRNSASGLGEIEVPFATPSSWRWAKLGDIAVIERGGSPRPIKSFLTTDAEGLNWIKIGDTAKGGKYITSASEKIRRDGLSKTRMVYPGDFLLTNSMSFGRPYITQIVGCIHDGWLRISPPTELDRDYLYSLLSSPYVRRYFVRAAAGAVVMNLNAEKVRELPVPLPPIHEQHRIVAKVDELMALCDRLEAEQADAEAAHAKLVEALLASLTQARDASDFRASWQQLAEHFHTLFTTEASIDALKRNLVDLAIGGRLVEQRAGATSARSLLQNIQRAKLERGVKASVRAKASKGGKERDECLRTGWASATFDDVVLEVATGPFGSLIHQSDYVHGGVPLINPSHMVGGRIVHDSTVTLPAEKAEELTSYRLESGDMVMARRGEVGRVALVTDAEHGWLCGTGSFRLRFTPDVAPSFIRLLFAAPSVRHYLAGAAVGTTMVNLNHGVLLQMPVALPPLEEQVRIVAKADELFALCDQLKLGLIQAQQHHEHLASVLVEQAVA